MHNCGTCESSGDDGIGHWRCMESIPFVVAYEYCDSDHPSDQHPCAHGTPIVASAIAEVEFRVADKFGTVDAYHHRMCIAERGALGDTWYRRGGKYCKHCGLPLPTAEQLPLMFERWKEERK